MRLVQDLERLAHLQDADHVAVIDIAVIAQRNAEIEAVVDAVPVHLANVVVDAAGARHGAADAGVDGQFARQHADALGARHQDFVADQQLLKLVEEAGKFLRRLCCAWSSQPAGMSTRQPPKRM